MSVETAVYEQGRRRAEMVPLQDTFEQLREDGVFAWIGLHEPTAEEFESVRREFNLHELAVEDAIRAHQRPKLEFYGDSFLMVLKTARWIDDGEETLGLGEILVFVGNGFIISVSHGDAALDDVRLEMEQRPDLLTHGPSAALYAIVDRVVDDYVPVLDELDSAIRDTETEVFSPSRSNPAGRIYQLKRAVLDLLGVVMPLVPEMEKLSAAEHALIDADMRPYFRDIHDHLLRDSVQLQGFRELLTNVLAANLTQASVRQNEDVRKISAWAAIIAVPTAIAGIYGMNFKYMPELNWRIGYPLVLAVIAIICFYLYRRFRRVGWL
jgi:magnesium transporter